MNEVKTEKKVDEYYEALKAAVKGMENLLDIAVAEKHYDDLQNLDQSRLMIQDVCGRNSPMNSTPYSKNLIRQMNEWDQ